MILDLVKLVEIQQEIYDLTRQYHARSEEERAALVPAINEKAVVLFSILLENFEADQSEDTQLLVSDLFAGCFDDKNTCSVDDLQALGAVLPYAVIKRVISNERAPIMLFDTEFADVVTRFRPLILTAKSREFTDRIALYPAWAKANGYAT